MKSFTLLELMIVVAIIGALATISFVHYSAYQEKALDSEVEGNLAQIIAAERVYFMERLTYYVSGNELDLNNNLRIMLPTANMRWDYLTTQSGGATKCCAQATRTGGPMVRNWRLCNSETIPVLGVCGGAAGNCP